MKPEFNRCSIRLPQYDYSQAGVYFVTVCSHERRCLFCKIDNFRIHLNPVGRVVSECWMEIPCHFANVSLDAFVVMPNHVHRILVLNVGARQLSTTAVKQTVVGAQHAAPLQGSALTVQRRKVVPRSLAAIIRSFKSVATKRVRESCPGVRASIWQRNYYEHVVRRGEDLDSIRRYIWANVEHWAEDEENPANLASSQRKKAHRRAAVANCNYPVAHYLPQGCPQLRAIYRRGAACCAPEPTSMKGIERRRCPGAARRRS